MQRFARVVAKSNLIQLDREFDFIVPENLAENIAVGQQVSFPFGRSKKLQQGFVIKLIDSSEFATSEIADILHPSVVLNEELFRFCRQVADRQCVALGEILTAAIPDHMSRVLIEEEKSVACELDIVNPVQVNPSLSSRSAVLTSTKRFTLEDNDFADWAFLALAEANAALSAGKSAIVVVPDSAELEELSRLADVLGLANWLVTFSPNQKKSDRFKAFHRAASLSHCLVIGTRSAIYAPIQNLGLVVLYDDLDDSLREQGSPFTNARELALMRATDGVRLLFLAPYRSIEIQRLVEIGYLSDHDVIAAPPRVSFTEPSVRFDDASFNLVRERLSIGPVLILLPRKGSSSSLYCGSCSSKLRCDCGGLIWEPTHGIAICRICKKPHVRCQECQASGFRRGRTGSERTVSELGRVFPQVAIAEATAEKKPSGLKSKNQIVVATPGSAPRVRGGYSALLILDTDIWLSRQSLAAEQLAIRDWTTALQLLAKDGRAVISGLDKELGQAFSMQQHRQLAAAQLSELRMLGLPPATRIASIECAPEHLESVVTAVKEVGAKTLSVDSAKASVLISFAYQLGPEVSKTLRAIALRTSARLQGTSMRRGIRIVMDDPDAL